ncbi:putative U3 small nucleolar RNA-associated protein 18 [Grifola frondosa]|uniref:Putative U3 small nucleolar RNA-associated protein 18 n=1 Tax=Grifola frondosa TaxID=5627 RepID=A0A1C7MRT7_GRIFR|nr:putative U3 small nucleolar RNA-associated protein 18 [Grifola frondosa]
MAKHARKKQKTSKSFQESVQPLGSAVSHADESTKDDEERRLESLLFGTSFSPPEDAGNKTYGVLDGEVDETGGGTEFQNLLDSDVSFLLVRKHFSSNICSQLFFVDDAIGNSASTSGNIDIDEDMLAVEPDQEDNVTKDGHAWMDPDDTTLQVSLATDKRRRKLRDALSEDEVGGREYERRLRRQFQKINPTPEWAANARHRLHGTKAKRRSSSTSSESEEDEALPDLLSSTGGILSTRKSKIIAHGTLSIERLRDANHSAKAEGEIKTVQFHPSAHIPVLLTASSDRRLRLFNVDGHTNPHLQTLHLPSLPLTNAIFHPNGTSVLLTGPRPFYYTYDLQTGTAQRSPRGLWGTTFANANQAAQDAGMEVCAFDPSGSVLAVAGRRGHVHLVDWRAGGGQVVGSVKMNAGVQSLWWSGDELMSLGEDAEVYVWDVGERRCVRRWKDDGGFGSRLLAGDGAGKYLAIGSRSGLVNIYGSDGAASFGTERPKPLKTIGNLTTSISTLRFNHDSQLLAIASNTKKDQMRMIHLPSLTSFSNWPTSGTPLGHVTSVDFSAGTGEYVAIGNNRGRVLLYHLRDLAAL